MRQSLSKHVDALISSSSAAQANNQSGWSVSEQTNEVYQQIMESKVRLYLYLLLTVCSYTLRFMSIRLLSDLAIA